MRKDHINGRDLFTALPPDPLAALDAWFDEAVRAEEAQPDAMALATASAEGEPSVRLVLYKGLRDGALVFYTNYGSRKARDLAANPRAEAAFYWRGLRRQVRAAGRVERISAADSAAYFRSRPRESQLSALASRQSEPLASREELEARVRALQAAHGDGPLPAPGFWGGYRLIAERFEFWENRPDRLHERVAYQRRGNDWARTRLNP